VTVKQRYTVEEVFTPAGVPSDTPQFVDLELGWCVLNRIDLRIPPGPSGLAGTSIYQTGTQLWPWGDLGTWIVGDDEQYDIDINTEIDNGITIATYNIDVYSHTMYYKFLYTPISVTAAVPTYTTTLPVY
jgi:hypothetical protein